MHTREYTTWTHIICRCYDEKFKDMFSSYCGQVTVCDEWLNFQNFAEWFNQNKYAVNERLHVDKDILIKGNKIYSPDTCLLVPQRINMMFMDTSSRRIHNKDLPQGIKRTTTGKYHADYNTKGLGNFEKLDDAVNAYNAEKEKCVHKVAEEYKDMIPFKVYDALIKWSA